MQACRVKSCLNQLGSKTFPASLYKQPALALANPLSGTPRDRPGGAKRNPNQHTYQAVVAAVAVAVAVVVVVVVVAVVGSSSPSSRFVEQSWFNKFLTRQACASLPGQKFFEPTWFNQLFDPASLYKRAWSKISEPNRTAAFPPLPRRSDTDPNPRSPIKHFSSQKLNLGSTRLGFRRGSGSVALNKFLLR